MKSIILNAQSVRTLCREKGLVIEKTSPEPPYDLGEIIFIREPWHRLKDPCTGEPTDRFSYAADAAAEPVDYKWASPVAMPADAIRLYAAVSGLVEKTETRGEEVVQLWEIELELVDKRFAESEEQKGDLAAEVRKQESERRLAEITARLEVIEDIKNSPDQFTSEAIEEALAERDELYEELELLQKEISGSEENAYTVSFGTCRYCGQVINVGPHPSPKEADETATKECSCPDACRERNIEELVEEALDRVNQLFGEPAEWLGFTPLEEKAPLELLRHSVELLARRIISSATIQIRGACRAKLSITPKGKIKVARIETRSYGLEAGE